MLLQSHLQIEVVFEELYLWRLLEMLLQSQLLIFQFANWIATSVRDALSNQGFVWKWFQNNKKHFQITNNLYDNVWQKKFEVFLGYQKAFERSACLCTSFRKHFKYFPHLHFCWKLLMPFQLKRFYCKLSLSISAF